MAAHGNFDSAKCIKCQRPHEVEHVREAVFAKDGNPCYCVKQVRLGEGVVGGGLLMALLDCC